MGAIASAALGSLGPSACGGASTIPRRPGRAQGARIYMQLLHTLHPAGAVTLLYDRIQWESTSRQAMSNTWFGRMSPPLRNSEPTPGPGRRPIALVAEQGFDRTVNRDHRGRTNDHLACHSGLERVCKMT
jgi:hypothetical protein